MVVVCLSSFSLERRTGFSSGFLMSAFCTMASTSLLSLTDGTELSRDVGCGLSRCALLPRELRPSVTITEKIIMHYRCDGHLANHTLCSAEAEESKSTLFNLACGIVSSMHKRNSYFLRIPREIPRNAVYEQYKLVPLQTKFPIIIRVL